LRKLLQPVEEERRRKEVGIYPQTGGRDADEVSPSVPAKGRDDSGDVHPRLKEMQPADIGLPVSRYRQHQDKDASADQNEPFRGLEAGTFTLHDDDGTRWGTESSGVSAENLPARLVGEKYPTKCCDSQREKVFLLRNATDLRPEIPNSEL